MIHFFNLIRWKNLLLILLVQTLIKFALFPSFNVNAALNNSQFAILVIATIFIAAAGNIINDICDIETDSINRPSKVIVDKHISEKAAFNMFIFFNIFGVGLGFFLANNIDKSSFATIFVIISALLYVYSTYLKSLLLVGNIVISFLVSLGILIVGIFDLIPSLNSINNELHIGVLQILLVYCGFAFILNLIREIVKDIEDINGDHNAEMNTLPIVLGRERTRAIAFTLSLIPIFEMIYMLIESLYKYQLVLIYLLLFVVAPMIYTSIKLFSAEREKDYHQVSQLIKVIMLFGVLSLLMFPLIINNA